MCGATSVKGEGRVGAFQNGAGGGCFRSSFATRCGVEDVLLAAETFLNICPLSDVITRICLSLGFGVDENLSGTAFWRA